MTVWTDRFHFLNRINFARAKIRREWLLVVNMDQFKLQPAIAELQVCSASETIVAVVREAGLPRGMGTFMALHLDVPQRTFNIVVIDLGDFDCLVQDAPSVLKQHTETDCRVLDDEECPSRIPTSAMLDYKVRRFALVSIAELAYERVG